MAILAMTWLASRKQQSSRQHDRSPTRCDDDSNKMASKTSTITNLKKTKSSWRWSGRGNQRWRFSATPPKSYHNDYQTASSAKHDSSAASSACSCSSPSSSSSHYRQQLKHKVTFSDHVIQHEFEIEQDMSSSLKSILWWQPQDIQEFVMAERYRKLKADLDMNEAEIRRLTTSLYGVDYNNSQQQQQQDNQDQYPSNANMWEEEEEEEQEQHYHYHHHHHNSTTNMQRKDRVFDNRSSQSCSSSSITTSTARHRRNRVVLGVVAPKHGGGSYLSCGNNRKD